MVSVIIDVSYHSNTGGELDLKTFKWIPLAR